MNSSFSNFLKFVVFTFSLMSFYLTWNASIDVYSIVLLTAFFLAVLALLSTYWAFLLHIWTCTNLILSKGHLLDVQFSGLQDLQIVYDLLFFVASFMLINIFQHLRPYLHSLGLIKERLLWGACRPHSSSLRLTLHLESFVGKTVLDFKPSNPSSTYFLVLENNLVTCHIKCFSISAFRSEDHCITVVSNTKFLSSYKMVCTNAEVER